MQIQSAVLSQVNHEEEIRTYAIGNSGAVTDRIIWNAILIDKPVEEFSPLTE